jgi:hypothetical protein
VVKVEVLFWGELHRQRFPLLRIVQDNDVAAGVGVLSQIVKRLGVSIGSDREPPDLKTSLQFLTQRSDGDAHRADLLDSVEKDWCTTSSPA